LVVHPSGLARTLLSEQFVGRKKLFLPAQLVPADCLGMVKKPILSMFFTEWLFVQYVAHVHCFCCAKTMFDYYSFGDLGQVHKIGGCQQEDCLSYMFRNDPIGHSASSGTGSGALKNTPFGLHAKTS
jgi:hypothetical protein